MISTQVLWICSRPAPVSGFKQLASHQGFSYQCEIANTLAEAQKKLVFQDFDSVVLHLDKAAVFTDGLLTECVARSIPMIVIMPLGQEDTILTLIQQGAADFLVEDLEGNYLKLLPLKLSQVTQALMADKLVKSISKRHAVMLKEPAIQEPVIQELIIQESHIQETITQKPVIQESCTKKTINQESIVKELVAQPLNDGNEMHQKEVGKTASNRQYHQLIRSELTRQIQQQQFFWRSLIDALPDQILVRNCEDPYLLTNQAAVTPCSDNDFLAIIKDIANRKNTELALQRNQETTDALIQAIPDLLLRIHRDGTYLDIRNGERSKFCTSHEQPIGRNLRDLLPPEMVQLRLQYIEQALATGEVQTYEQEFVQDGEICYEEVRVAPCGKNEVLAVVRNITDRKQAEIALRTALHTLDQLNQALTARVEEREIALHASEERWHLALMGTNDGIWDWDLKTNTIFFSSRWKQMRGFEDSEIDNTPEECLRRIHPEDFERVMAAIAAHFSGAVEFLEVEYRVFRKDDSTMWILGRGKALRDESGKVIRMIGSDSDITRRKQAELDLQKLNEELECRVEQRTHQIILQSLHDDLTGLPNRNFLTQRLQQLIQSNQTSPGKPFAVMFLDLDNFKVINDSLGHLAGDVVLILVAQKIYSLVKETDLVARLGGDEFVLLLEDIAGGQDPVNLAEQLLAELKSPLLINGREVFINTSIGIVLGKGIEQSPTDLLRDADIAMYQAKAQGRGRYALFSEEMHVQALQRLQLEHDLRIAIDQGELTLHFQPIVSLKTGALHGFEALVRWQHPIRGNISPANFIPIAEETGLIVPLDRWVLFTACQQLAVWHQRYPEQKHLKIGVNLSVKDLLRPDLLDIIDQVLSQTGLQGYHLSLEITESMLIENIQGMAVLLERLKNRSIDITIDDFGTGYSSLSYLHQLPVDAFKIDRSFVMNMEASRRNADIVETIIGLSDRLILQTIAEGIETEDQLHHLQRLGCELGQGYWFSPPLPADAAEQFLQSSKQSPK